MQSDLRMRPPTFGKCRRENLNQSISRRALFLRPYKYYAVLRGILEIARREYANNSFEIYIHGKN